MDFTKTALQWDWREFQCDMCNTSQQETPSTWVKWNISVLSVQSHAFYWNQQQSKPFPHNVFNGGHSASAAKILELTISVMVNCGVHTTISVMVNCGVHTTTILRNASSRVNSPPEWDHWYHYDVIYLSHHRRARERPFARHLTYPSGTLATRLRRHKTQSSVAPDLKTLMTKVPLLGRLGVFRH